MTSVLFVCLGNICRSPMAEGIFRKKLGNSGLVDHYLVDSAGTAAYHAGEGADPRTLDVLRRHDALCPMVARQVHDGDFDRFAYILAMDRSNLTALQRQAPASARARIHLALAPTSGSEVPDPYYGGPGGFDRVYAMLDEALDVWLARWEREAGRQA